MNKSQLNPKLDYNEVVEFNAFVDYVLNSVEQGSWGKERPKIQFNPRVKKVIFQTFLPLDLPQRKDIKNLFESQTNNIDWGPMEFLEFIRKHRGF